MGGGAFAAGIGMTAGARGGMTEGAGAVAAAFGGALGSTKIAKCIEYDKIIPKYIQSRHCYIFDTIYYVLIRFDIC